MGAPRSDHERRVRLLTILEGRVRSHRDWWTFEPEGSVEGFKGPGPITIIGDQPSKSEWPPGHPNRALLYGTLRSLGIGSAHLTDVIKRRDECSASAKELPPDFGQHLAILRREFKIIS